MFGIKRPKSIDDKTWGNYQEDVTAKVLLLEKQGWPIESIKEFGKYFKEMLGRKVQSSNISEIVASCYSDTQIVGTKAFDNMWYAWKAEELRRIANKIDSHLEPDDKFWGSISSTVRTAFLPTPEGNPTALANIEKRIHIENALKGKLGKQAHLFRYVISYQQAEYISNLYAEGTDEEKLARYIREHKVDWSVEESARLH
ncbi:MAG: DUF3114 domain-containing protein [Mogibacterium diversum]|nr:DUF3114 domain-containing protein [Mogibacterium diversum]